MLGYHTSPALREDTASTGMVRIGVICHEMGHFFGLPDLYDYSGETDGLGDWCLMAGGAWNGSSGHRPAHLSAWAKCFLGFASPFQMHSQSGVSLPNVEQNPVVGLLRDGMTDGQYFLIENRAKRGFDDDAAIYPGLLIYHVDTRYENNDLSTWPHPLVKIEEADGNNSLGGKTAGSEAGDVWTSTSGLAGGFRDQTANASANAMVYQGGEYYNRADQSASYSCNRLANFSAAGDTMTVDVSTLRTAVGSQVVNTRDYTLSWAACSEAAKYEIQEASKITLASFADSAEDEDLMHENWSLAGTAHRDATGKGRGPSASCYAMPYYDGTRWYASAQSLTMRKSFKVTSSSVLSFYFLSRISDGSGRLLVQISKDGGSTWKTLDAISDYYDPWTEAVYNYAKLNAQGVVAGDTCQIRFVANFEQALGWPGFPGYGFALDDISITGIEMDGYGGWSTVANDVAATTYTVVNGVRGVHAYRARAFANSTWQAFGPVGEVTVNNRAPVAQELTLARTPGLTLKAALTELQTSWSDPDGDTLKLTAISETSEKGVSLTRLNVTKAVDDSYIISSSALLGYPNNSESSDRFSYTITDSQGGSTVGYVNLVLSTDPMAGRATGPITVSGSSVTVNFAGIPNYNYHVQRSTDLGGHWTTITATPIAAPANGRFSRTDDFADLGSPPASAIYRLTWTP
jgi:hypothetical protein